MTINLLVFLLILGAPIIWGIMIFNQLVALKHNTKKASSNIDVLLKQRNDELPKLIDTCKQHMQYEQETLEKVMLARRQISDAMQKNDPQALHAAEQRLNFGLDNLYAVVENYPDLKASNSFIALQQRITNLEESITDRREFYNESANIHNTRIEQFPDVIIAKWFNFKNFRLTQFASKEIQNVDVGERFAR